MMKRNFILISVIGIMLLATSVWAVPYSVNFDADGTDTSFAMQETWGWNLEGQSHGEYLNGQAVDIITYQNLGTNGELGDGDLFQENLTNAVWSGLESNGSTPLFPVYIGNVPLYVDSHLEGMITDYDSGADSNPTTITNLNGLADDSWTSVFTSGYANMYLDVNGNKWYDAGTDILAASLDLVSSPPLTMGPSVYTDGGLAATSSDFVFNYMNPDFFATAFSRPGDDLMAMVGNGWVLSLQAGSINGYHNAIGVGGLNNDEILFGFQENGIDAMLEAVPEPGTLVLLGFGLLGLAGYTRKRKMRRM